MTRVRMLTASAVLAAGAVVALSSPALAAGATISPASQTISYGGTATWGGAWSGGAPYNTTFTYGDGSTSTVINNTTSTSHGYYRTFYPCTATTYTQKLSITALGGGGATATAYASTHITKGGAC